MLQDLASWVWGQAGADKTNKAAELIQVKLDKFVTFVSIAMPVALLLFSTRYAPDIGKSSGLVCAPIAGSGIAYGDISGVAQAGFTEAFYLTNYCWENMVDYPVKDYNLNGKTIQVANETSGAGSTDLSYIKMYPYFLMAYTVSMFLPYLIWSNLYATRVKEQLDFFISGMEEGLTETIGGLAEIINESRSQEIILELQKEDTGVYKMLEKKLKEDKNLDTKFKTYKLFLKNLAGSTQLVRGYTYRRVLHYILNIAGTALIFYFYLWEHKSEFNCVFDWHVEARGYKDNIQPAVLCAIQGVELVQLITLIICIVNVLVLILYVFSLFAIKKDMLRDIKILKMLPSPVIIDYDEIKNAATPGVVSDLHLVLNLSKNSLRDFHPTFAFCMQANKMARTMYHKEEKRAEREGRPCSHYLVILKGLVSWGVHEANDDKLSQFLANIHHGAKK